MDAVREVELKLEIQAADLRRLQRHPLVEAFAQGRAVTRTLESVYYDTRDDDLASAGFALRIRRCGAECLQTVKGEGAAAGGLSDRLEVEAPVDGETPDLGRIPDPALLARLRAIVGEKPLAPVFRADFRRTRRILRKAESEWSLDLDEGEIAAGDERAPIREIELELRSGDPSRLLEFALMLQEQLDVVPATRSKAERGYALARGVPIAAKASRRVAIGPDADVAAARRAVVGQCLAQLAANAPCAREGADPEGVHQMRVGVRRARLALAFFAPLLPERRLRRLRSELGWLGRELGAARDLDVFTHGLLPALAPHRGGDPAFERLAAEALALRDDRQVAVREVLRSRRYARLVLELGHSLHSREWRNPPASGASARILSPARDFAASLLEGRHRGVRRIAAHLGECDDEARHDLRIRVRQLRYGGEFFRDFFPGQRVEPFLRKLGRLQRVLGRMNDVVTSRGILEMLLARVGEERTPAHDRVVEFIEDFGARQLGDEAAALDAAWRKLRREKPFWRD